MQLELIEEILKKIRAKKKVTEATITLAGQKFDLKEVFSALHEMFAGPNPVQNLWGNAGWGEGKYEIYHEQVNFGGKLSGKSLWILIKTIGKYIGFSKDVKLYLILSFTYSDYDLQQKTGSLSLKVEVYTNYSFEEIKNPILKKVVEKLYKEAYETSFGQIKGMVKKKLIPSIANKLYEKTGAVVRVKVA